MSTTAIFGAGVMGETLLAGLLRAGWNAPDLIITERRAERAAELTAKYGVRVADNAAAARAADTLVLVVKPQDMGALLREIAPHVSAEHNVVASLAAGITTSYLESLLPQGVPVVRVMPNTPAQVNRGMAAVCGGQHCAPEHLGAIRALLETTGKVEQIPEYLLDAVTAISGSGPAYIFYIAEAMIEAGVGLGMPRATATELVTQTVLGAATMLRETGQHPTVLREQVTSPGGTTAAALRELDEHKVRAAFMSAMEAAAHRSRELSGD